MCTRRALCSITQSLVRLAFEAEPGLSTWRASHARALSTITHSLPSLREFRGHAEPQAAAFSASAIMQDAAVAETQISSSSEEASPDDVYARIDRRISEGYKITPKRVFAVVEVGGTQYKVTPDDVIITEKLDGVDVNDTLRLQRVLLLGSTAETIIGRPYVPGASVVAAVEEHFLDGKVLSFYKRRRKNSRRLRGHRQPLTTLRILDVEGIEEADAEVVAPSGAQ